MSQPISSAKILPLSSPSNPCMCPFYVSWLNLPKNSLDKLFQWVYWIYSVEQGPKLRVTKAVMSKNYRFRSFAISIYMVLGHVKQWLLIWGPFPLVSTESTIGALHGQQSAVHCLSSNCGRNFSQNSLVFALLRAFCFC